MKPSSQSVRVWSILALVCSAGNSGASEIRKNVWGFYVAPTTHQVSSGNAVEEMESNTQLDIGTFYSRVLRPNLSLRVDVRWASREYMAQATTSVLPSDYYLVPTSEDFIEFPVLLLATRDVSVGEATLRISMGGGAYVATLVSQEFAVEPPPLFPDAVEPLDAGGYTRYGWVGDGGVALMVDGGSAFFLNLRIQDDVSLSGEPENSVAYQDMAFGFYAGFGWLF